MQLNLMITYKSVRIEAQIAKYKQTQTNFVFIFKIK